VTQACLAIERIREDAVRIVVGGPGDSGDTPAGAEMIRLGAGPR
jgi:hypothetical protein